MVTASSIESHVAQLILSEEGWRQYQLGDVGHRELAPYIAALQRLSASYTGHTVGKRLTPPISQEVEAQAYALYYLPINATKMAPLLGLIEHIQATPLRVLDFGCGPATASLALLLQGNHLIDLTCVDSSPHMRAVALSLLDAPPVRERLAKLSIIPNIPVGEFDLIIAANVLAELDQPQGDALVETLLSQLAPRGALLLMEPGQQLHTRRLMHIRDRLLHLRPELNPLFPCLRLDPCPMLTNSPEDWCHGVIEWQQPHLSQQLDSLLGFNKHRIKYAAFLFQLGAQLRPGVRVLTPPRKGHRGIDTLVCSSDYYGVATIRKGKRSESTRPLEKSNVYNRLSFSKPVSHDVSPDITIKKLSL